MGIEIKRLEEDFRDGVNLILLIGLLEGTKHYLGKHLINYPLKGFFVPLYCYDQCPSNDEAKIKNVRFAFEELLPASIRPRNRASDVVHGDLAAILRVLFSLHVTFKQNQDSKFSSGFNGSFSKGQPSVSSNSKSHHDLLNEYIQ